jgi:hypothetical protein
MAVADEAKSVALWLDNRVELSIPAAADLLFLARMTAASVGARANFEGEQLEDLRLAVDELLAKLFWHRELAGTIRLEFEWSEGVIEVVASLEAHDRPGSNGHAGASPITSVTGQDVAEELSRCLLDALADHHDVDRDGPVPVSWLRMHRRGSS